MPTSVVGPGDCLVWSRDASQWCCSVMGALLLLYTMHHGPYTIRTNDAQRLLSVTVSGTPGGLYTSAPHCFTIHQHCTIHQEHWLRKSR